MKAASIAPNARGYDRPSVFEPRAVDHDGHSRSSPSGRSINSFTFPRLTSTKFSLTTDFSTPEAF